MAANGASLSSLTSSKFARYYGYCDNLSYCCPPRRVTTLAALGTTTKTTTVAATQTTSATYAARLFLDNNGNGVFDAGKDTLLTAGTVVHLIKSNGVDLGSGTVDAKGQVIIIFARQLPGSKISIVFEPVGSYSAIATFKASANGGAGAGPVVVPLKRPQAAKVTGLKVSKNIAVIKGKSPVGTRATTGDGGAGYELICAGKRPCTGSVSVSSDGSQFNMHSTRLPSGSWYLQVNKISPTGVRSTPVFAGTAVIPPPPTLVNAFLNDRRIATITLKGEAGATFRVLYSSLAPAAPEVVADSSGVVTLYTEPLEPGSYLVSATQENEFGESDPRLVPLVIRIPKPVSVRAVWKVTANIVAVSGSGEPNSTVNLYSSGVLAGTNTTNRAGNFTVISNELPPGEHALSLTSTFATSSNSSSPSSPEAPAADPALTSPESDPITAGLVANPPPGPPVNVSVELGAVTNTATIQGYGDLGAIIFVFYTNGSFAADTHVPLTATSTPALWSVDVTVDTGATSFQVLQQVYELNSTLVDAGTVFLGITQTTNTPTSSQTATSLLAISTSTTGAIGLETTSKSNTATRPLTATVQTSSSQTFTPSLSFTSASISATVSTSVSETSSLTTETRPLSTTSESETSSTTSESATTSQTTSATNTRSLTKTTLTTSTTIRRTTQVWYGVGMTYDGQSMWASVGTGSGSLWRSTDAGQTWSQQTGAGNGDYWSYNCNRNNATICFAGSGTGTLLTKSTDGGVTWNTITPFAGSASYYPQAFSSSQDGRIWAVGAFFGTQPAAYYSTDYGSNWTQVTAALGDRAISTAVSSNGSLITIVTQSSGYIWTSNNTGTTFNQRGGAASDWYAVAISTDGAFQVAAKRNSYIFSSSDYGVTWTQLTNSGSRAWGSVACSGDGTYILAGTTGSPYVLYSSSDKGATWSQVRSSSYQFYGVSVSEDGMIQAAAETGGYMWISYNFGANFSIYGLTTPPPTSTKTTSTSLTTETRTSSTSETSTTLTTSTSLTRTTSLTTVTTTTTIPRTTRVWYAIGMTYDGSTMWASAGTGSGSLWRSNDFGQTWNQQTGAGTADYWSYNCNRMNATVCFAGSGTSSLMKKSTDGGSTWTDISSTFAGSYNLYPQAFSSSEDGKVWMAGAFFGSNPSSAYYSTNYGANWTQVNNAGLGTRTIATAVSFNGSLMTTVGQSSGNIWTSNNTGLTFNQRGGAAGDWWAIAMSSDGAFQAAAKKNSYIFTSNDYGSSWTQQTGSGSRAWAALACSGDGSYLIAGTATSPYVVYTSSDRGVTWNLAFTSTVQIYGVAMSLDGSIQAFAETGGYIRISYNYGANFSIYGLSSPPPTSTKTTSTSLTTETRTSSTSETTTSLTTSTSLTQTTTQTTTKTSTTIVRTRQVWYGVGMTYDGQTMWASIGTGSGGLRRSTDAGVTWQQESGAGTGDYWSYNCNRNNATICFAGSGTGTLLKKSTDGGVTWNTITPFAGSASYYPQAFSSSQDGRIWAVGAFFGTQPAAYYSTDYGSNWTQVTAALGDRAISTAVSSNGSLITIVTQSSGYIWTSNNTGTTSNQRGGSAADWYANCMSDTGSFQAAVRHTSGYIYTSTDYGLNWTAQTGSGARGWGSIACSANGTYLLAGTTSSPYVLYRSTDSGVTWSLVMSSTYQFYGVSMSSDGATQLAAETGGYIWVSYDYGATFATTG